MAIIRASHRFKNQRRRRNPSQRYSLQDKALQIVQGKTQKEAAAELGISTRTLRRWIKGEVETPTKAHQQAVNKVSTRARRRAYRSGAPKNIPVPPPIQRVGRQDFADAKNMRRNDVNAYVFAEAGRMQAVRFNVRVPKSKDYPRGIASTEWADLTGMTGGAINNVLKRARQQGEIIGVFTIDPDELEET